ncbi:hypothetical protein AWJ14_15020 [Hoeflea olei]|uniref:Cytochrome b561 bacterial/Ni-hydrogenase domain-containing protein n=1 Tax=Hoeflea olei TaxID=1480615 RepID=A0A1C1YQT5_9HYPH|nr:hypothetical protein AWJ14_15020 [Hoeflea olei]
MKSTPTAYGAVAVGLHWLSALLIVGLLVSGTIADETADPAAKASILSMHAPFGILVLVLTLARIAWWRFDIRPEPLGDDTALQKLAAKGVHGLLYLVVLVMGASGIALFALSGAGDIVFFGAPGPLPDFGDYAPRPAHGIGANLLIALLAAHVLAALYHHFVKRDATVSRMWFGGKV